MNNQPTFWLHVVEIVIGIVIIGAITFQIVRPTHSEKTTVQAGGTKVDYYQGATIKPGFGGCVRIQTEKYKEQK